MEQFLADYAKAYVTTILGSSFIYFTVTSFQYFVWFKFYKGNRTKFL